MLPSYLKEPKIIVAIGIMWIPIVFCVGSLFYSITGASFLITFWLVTPILYLELFFVLSTWYVCKSLPLDTKNLANILLRHFISAISMVSIWFLISSGYTATINHFYPHLSFGEYFRNSIFLFTGTGFFLYFLGVLFHYTVLVQEQARETQKRMSQIEVSARESQLRALHTSINPHFLFNSLTALSTLTVKNPDQAQQMCVQLSEYLRYNLQYEQKQSATIGEELENINNYLTIEQIRLGAHLKIDTDVDKSVHSVKTIPFLLLPLVENAVKHGIQQNLAGGKLYLQIHTQGQYLWIRVQNPVETHTPANGMGMGLRTLKKRLVAEYGDQFRLKIDHKNSMFIVDLKIPRKWRKR